MSGFEELLNNPVPEDPAHLAEIGRAYQTKAAIAEEVGQLQKQRVQMIAKIENLRKIDPAGIILTDYGKLVDSKGRPYECVRP